MNECNIEGYHLEHGDNNGEFEGCQGVAMFISNKLSYKARADVDPKDIMSLSVHLTIPHRKPVLITAVYRHPRSTRDFVDRFDRLLSRIDQTHMDSIITGDFNVDFKHVESTGSLAHIVNNISLSYNFKQVISQPTRVNERSSTIIDLTFTNIESKISHGVAVVSVADHLMNFLVIHMKKEPIHRHKYVSSRNYRRLNSNNLLHDLNAIPWSVVETFDDVDDAWYAWKSLFVNIINTHAPIRKFRAKSNPCHWHSEDIDQLKTIRDDYHSQAIDSNDPHAWAVYKKLRNHITNLCRDAKKILLP